jgi:hypothetical protein
MLTVARKQQDGDVVAADARHRVGFAHRSGRLILVKRRHPAAVSLRQ